MKVIVILYSIIFLVNENVIILINMLFYNLDNGKFYFNFFLNFNLFYLSEGNVKNDIID